MHKDEIPPGTLYLLILRTLARSGEQHGYEIANAIQRVSKTSSKSKRAPCTQHSSEC